VMSEPLQLRADHRGILPNPGSRNRICPRGRSLIRFFCHPPLDTPEEVHLGAGPHARRWLVSTSHRYKYFKINS
jgi:hypothetical protein